MAQHLELGRRGEELAKAHLLQGGYEIITQNWTYRKAEVDLIARHQNQLIFVEVKTRSGNRYGEPEDFVDARKQKLLAMAANEYVYQTAFEGEIRFDIIAILFNAQKEFTLSHIKDAFWPLAL
ncbi:YraN family protein [Mucilaginibacter koreensis]